MGSSIIRSNLKSLFMKKPQNCLQQNRQLLFFFPFKPLGPKAFRLTESGSQCLTSGHPATKPRRLTLEQLPSSQDGSRCTSQRRHSLSEGCQQCCEDQIRPKPIPTNHGSHCLTLQGQLRTGAAPRLPFGTFRQGALMTPETLLSGLLSKTPNRFVP